MRPQLLLGSALLVSACATEVVAPVNAGLERVDAVALAADKPAKIKVDFEEFAVGAIHGQFDWQSIGGIGSTSTASRCAFYDHAIADNKGSAYDGNGFNKRSLRISNAVTSGCYTDHTFSARAEDMAGQAGAVSRSRDGTVDYAIPGASLRNHFDAEWTVLSATPAAQQPGLEVVVNPGRGDDHRMSWVRMADLADGIAVSFAQRADQANPGAIQVTTVATGLKRNKTHTIRLAIDFLDGPNNDVARVYVNGKLVHTGGSWETYYALETNGKLNFAGNPPSVNRLMFRTGSDTHRGVPGDPAPATLGKGFVFDDIRVGAWTVPITKDDCKDKGWQDLRDGDGEKFKNQGDCVSSVKGK